MAGPSSAEPRFSSAEPTAGGSGGSSPGGYPRVWRREGGVSRRTGVTPARASAGLAGRPPVRQLVGAVGDQAVLRADRGQLRELAGDLLPHAAERDAEDSLAAGEQVDDLVRRGALVDAHSVAHQRDLGEILGPVVTQVLDGGADLLQGNARVEKPFDDLEHEDVTEAVEALRPGAVRRAHAGLYEAGARPVVKLAVGDAGRGARRGAPIPDLGVAIVERARSSFGPTPSYRHGHLL